VIERAVSWTIDTWAKPSPTPCEWRELAVGRPCRRPVSRRYCASVFPGTSMTLSARQRSGPANRAPTGCERCSRRRVAERPGEPGSRQTHDRAADSNLLARRAVEAQVSVDRALATPLERNQILAPASRSLLLRYGEGGAGERQAHSTSQRRRADWTMKRWKSWRVVRSLTAT
jgi:hypothetical protein